MPFFRNTCLSFGLLLVLCTNAAAQERDVDGWMESANFILGVYSAEDIIVVGIMNSMEIYRERENKQGKRM